MHRTLQWTYEDFLLAWMLFPLVTISTLLEFTCGTMVSCYSWTSFTRNFANSCTNVEEFRFVLSGQLTATGRILNVIPGDFNRDGKLDILVMTEPSPPNRVTLDMALYLSPPRGFGTFIAFGISNRRTERPFDLGREPAYLTSILYFCAAYSDRCWRNDED